MCLTNAFEIKTAEKNILVYKELDGGEIHICIIPKDTKYVDGFYNGERDNKNRVSENLYYVGKWTLMNFLKAKFLCIFNVNLNKY